ncbi:ScbR family autoregulator-binding transcription factor [Streptomyces sp. NPDC102274]|uniref:ScbR family autoregulator-binding transcription factor n=1 Tax=Streptomyces sp. NPDC102274 TaxID=3366151 RepID=UPI00382196C3
MQTRSVRTRRGLVRAGAEMFDRKGYAEATLEQIAASAGVTKGALYFHFASKDGLLDAVEECAQALLRDFAGAQRRQNAPPVQSLIDLTHLLARALRQDPVLRASFRIAVECAGGRPSAGDFHQSWTAEALDLLARARTQGLLREGQPREGLQTLVCAAVCGIAVLAVTGSPHLDPGRGTAGVWDQLLPVLVPATDLARYRTGPPEDAPAIGDADRAPAIGDADRAPAIGDADRVPVR